VFNIAYLPELARWIYQQQFDFVYWNMMQDPYYFCVNSMPEVAKQQIVTELVASAPDQNTQLEFDRIIEFMNNGVSLDGELMRLKIRDLDNKRDQNLRHHHSKLADILQYHRNEKT
jgi:hypothetical protein